MVQKFTLLGHIVARAIRDGRILDIPLSKAFYKIMLGQVTFSAIVEITIYIFPFLVLTASPMS